MIGSNALCTPPRVLRLGRESALTEALGVRVPAKMPAVLEEVQLGHLLLRR